MKPHKGGPIKGGHLISSVLYDYKESQPNFNLTKVCLVYLGGILLRHITSFHRWDFEPQFFVKLEQLTSAFCTPLNLESSVCVVDLRTDQTPWFTLVSFNVSQCPGLWISFTSSLYISSAIPSLKALLTNLANPGLMSFSTGSVFLRYLQKTVICILRCHGSFWSTLSHIYVDRWGTVVTAFITYVMGVFIQI